MTFPHSDTMHLLLAICAGEKLDVADGVLRVHLPVRDGVKVIDDIVDDYAALESRGWITTDEPPRLTEQGEYALGRWMKAMYRKDVKVRTIRMGVFR